MKSWSIKKREPHTYAPSPSPIHATILHVFPYQCLGLVGTVFLSDWHSVRSYRLSHTCYMPCLPHLHRFDHPHNIWGIVQIKKSLIMQLSPSQHRYPVRKCCSLWQVAGCLTTLTELWELLKSHHFCNSSPLIIFPFLLDPNISDFIKFLVLEQCDTHNDEIINMLPTEVCLLKL